MSDAPAGASGPAERIVKFTTHEVGNYGVYTAVRAFARFLPYTGLRALGEGVLGAVAATGRGVSAQVADNYRGAFPELSEREVRRLVVRMFRAYTRSVIDFWRAESRGLEGIHFEIDRARVEELRARRPGCILVTAHLGNFELGGLAMASTGVKVNIVGLPELDSRVDELRRRIRARYGIEMIPVGSLVESFLRVRAAVERGESVAMAADRPLPKDDVEVQFFGRATRFLKSPGLLSALTGAPVVPVFFMEESPRRYRAIFGAQVFADRSRPTADAAHDVMQQVAAATEAVLRQYPEQWFNFYPYWPGAAPQESA